MVDANDDRNTIGFVCRGIRKRAFEPKVVALIGGGFADRRRTDIEFEAWILPLQRLGDFIEPREEMIF